MQPRVGDWANSTTRRVAEFVSGLGSSTVDGGVAFCEWWTVHLVRLDTAVREFLTPSSGRGALCPLLFFRFGMVLPDCPIVPIASAVSARCGDGVSFARSCVLRPR